MRVGFSTNTMACQPLKNFGKAKSTQNNHVNNSAKSFSSGCVSREEYDKLNAKYDLLSRFAVLQLEQYNQLAAKYRAIQK